MSRAAGASEGGGLRQRTMYQFAVLVVALYGVDLLIVGYASWELLSVRLFWALAMILTGQLIRSLSPEQVRWVSGSYGVVAALCYLGLLVFTGGSRSPYFAFFPMLPLIIALASMETLAAAVTCGLVSALGGGWLLHQAGEPLSQSCIWAVVMLTMMFFGTYGGAQFRKARRAEEAMLVERTRREALEKLAVSEHRRAQSEKLATIGRLAASVAHELNNPIAYVRSNLGFIEREVQRLPLESMPELREAFQDVSTGVERVRQIVSDLQSFSRMDATEEPMRCTLPDVVKDAARLASVRLKSVARLEVEMPPELPEVFVVRRRLAQVLLNLLVNAGDALESVRGAEGEVRVHARLEGSTVQLVIDDNGPGFPKEVLSRLFEPFFTTKGPERGTGLGLVLSREYVEQFGGTLTAMNRAEGGARLCITLPAGTQLQTAVAA
ncbi:sensor histidine kinase [Hyalangium versicolor]|uniref:sensor histidine kinase n=1 Tax=Hyalangium versicolor TaxID=2861190 RepID=UPI001CCA9F49|nr:ATP-binding protein [Hyalangium versicolor]